MATGITRFFDADGSDNRRFAFFLAGVSNYQAFYCPNGVMKSFGLKFQFRFKNINLDNETPFD